MRGFACGPMLPLVPARVAGSTSARRGRRYAQGPAEGSCCDGRRCAPTALWCSPLGRAPNSLRSLRSLRSNRRGEVSFGCALRAPTQGLRSSPSQKSPPAGPRAQRLPRGNRGGLHRNAYTSIFDSRRACRASDDHSPRIRSSVVLVEVNQGWQRGRRHPVGHGGGDFWGDEQRSLEVGTRSVHPKLTSPRLFERSERSERSEFGARLQGEQHSGVGAQRRPSQHEPPPCPTGCPLPRRSDNRTHSGHSNGSNGPKSDRHSYATVCELR